MQSNWFCVFKVDDRFVIGCLDVAPDHGIYVQSVVCASFKDDEPNNWFSANCISCKRVMQVRMRKLIDCPAGRKLRDEITSLEHVCLRLNIAEREFFEYHPSFLETKKALLKCLRASSLEEVMINLIERFGREDDCT